MSMHVAMSTDAGWALEQAGDFLAAEPVLNNLVLTLLHERHAVAKPGRYWVVRDGAAVAGVGFQSPLIFPLLLTSMSVEAVAALVQEIAGAGIELPGVNAEAPTAARCAGQWAERCKAPARPVAGLRIYECRAVHEATLPAGRPRRALAADRDLLVAWTKSFYAEVEEVGEDIEAMVERRLAAGRFWLWEDGGPVSMAAQTAPLAGVVRVYLVYTPPASRGRGYAGACVGRLSQGILAAGDRCMLYTALSNPTSSSVYHRIGYRAVAEGLRYSFG
jgi:GNAT superfamily N-acetyltransferase